MFETVQQICLGAATVFDTVLLFALIERRNWSFVRLPIVSMVFGAWLWHGGLFSLLLLTDMPGAWPWYAQSLCMSAMVAGVVLMPCGLMHASCRVYWNQLEVQSRPQPYYAAAYLPLLVLIPVVPWFFASGRGDFATVTAPLEVPYLLLTGLANVAGAAVFLGMHRRLSLPQARPFCLGMGIVLVAMTVFKCFAMLVARNLWPDTAKEWMFAVTLIPLGPALLFTYFVFRYNFLQIILERSLVYGASLACILLVHQIAFQDISTAVPAGYRLHVVVLELVILGGVVLLYSPLRERTAEALRYLLGMRASGVRERLRHLSREVSLQAGRPSEMMSWFCDSLREALQVDYVAGWLFDKGGAIAFRAGSGPSDEQGRWLYRRMRDADLVLCSRRQAPDQETLARLQDVEASLVVLKARPNVAGLLVLGRGPRQRDLGEEETNSVLLLIEQLAIALDNSVLQAQRLAAERRALQNEKLSALGLLVSSITHEVKNPLSSIKTIATVLSEELANSAHAEDLRLILSEVDRLTQTTGQLLDSVRPRSSPRAPASVAEVLGGTLRLMRHLAGQNDTVVEADVPADLPSVQGDEHALREIFFNLISNSVEAAGPKGRVSIQCHRENGFVVTNVSDTGPGIPDDVRRHLFEPFLTTKPTGTGLGLYVVGCRVRELGGEIVCRSSADEGTSFIVKLPTQSSCH